MTRLLAGKVALVTGAARGQGRAHAVRLGGEGAGVIAVDICADVDTAPYALSRPADLEHTVQLVRQQGAEVRGIQVDVRDLPRLTAAVDLAVAELGRLDIVVANAGIVSYGPCLELSAEQWDETIAVNLSGVWRTIRAAVPHIRNHRGGGSVIITSSVSGLRAIPNAAHYSAAKHGLVGLARVLAVELGGEGIRVNTIHPTNVDTPMIRNEATMELFLPDANDRSEEAFERSARAANVLPVPWVPASSISNMVVFLASDQGQYITGAAIPVDAGMAVRW